MPKSVQPKAKGDLHEIWQAETKADAETAFGQFLEKYDAKYQQACDCLQKDREPLLTFYDFPAEHWGHLRTTNPIESTFATIRLRHRKTRGNGTRRASLAMMFKPAQSAAKRWRRLRSHETITHVVEGRSFKDGILQESAAEKPPQNTTFDNISLSTRNNTTPISTTNSILQPHSHWKRH